MALKRRKGTPAKRKLRKAKAKLTDPKSTVRTSELRKRRKKR